MELSLDLRLPFIPKTISEFLNELSEMRDVSERLLKLNDLVTRLEEEMRKIDAFKRELPLCVLILNDAIVRLKEEMVQRMDKQDRPVVEEFLPLKTKPGRDKDLRIGRDSSDKKNWLSSVQLWTKSEKEEHDSSLTENPIQVCEEKNRGVASFVPYKRNFGVPSMVMEDDKEVSRVPSLSLMPPISELNSSNSISKGSSRGSSGSSLVTEPIKAIGHPPQQQQASKKQRRCWSPELHRRFVDALQQLGGAQGATPKQIRELMQVDGLTNDEVKSHLQKYRLHVRRLPPSSVAPAKGCPWMDQDQYSDKKSGADLSHSCSPQGPLLVGGSANGLSSAGGNSTTDAEEDEKSDGHSWKGGLHHQVEVNL